MEIKARYIGAGEFWNGIPARDLSNEDYAALTEEQRRLVDSGKLYEVQRPAQPSEAPADRRRRR